MINQNFSLILQLFSIQCDLESSRMVSIEQGKAYAEEKGLGFMETSALQSMNVEEAFNLVIRGTSPVLLGICWQNHFNVYRYIRANWKKIVQYSRD